MASGQDPKVALRKATSIGAAPPQPNPVLRWIAEQGDTLVGGAEAAAGLFDGNPGPEVLKAISVLPPALARKFGEQLLSRLKESGQWGDEMIEAFTAAQQRYPRLFGHIRAVKSPLSPLSESAGVQGAGWRGAVTAGVPGTSGRRTTLNPGWEEVVTTLSPEKRVQASLNTSTLGFRSNLKSPTNTVHHELAHAAQQLRRGNQFEDAYNQADDLVGYRMNPYEVRARQAGAKAELRNPTPPKPGMMERFGNTIDTRLEATPTQAEQNIEQLFTQYIRELRANNGEITPLATELYAKLRRLGSGSRELGVGSRGFNIFDK